MANILQTQLSRTIQESIGNALEVNRVSQHSVEEGTGSRLELDLAELKHQFEVFKAELAGSIAILKDIKVSRHRIESCLDTIVRDLQQFRKEWVDRDNLIDQASMELKINDLVDSIKDFRKEAADKQPPMIQASPACFFCESHNHKLANCPDRVFCVGCGGNMHPYDRCEEKDSVCERCHTPGHAAKVHYTNQKSLRTQLVLANPTAFDHFCAPPPAKPKNQRGIRIGLNREDRQRGDVAGNETDQTRGEEPVNDEGRGMGGRVYSGGRGGGHNHRRGGQGGRGVGGAPGFIRASSVFGRNRMN